MRGYPVPIEMGNLMNQFVFRCGYTLYADTCIGRCLHQRYINSFRKNFGDNAVHSKLTPFLFKELLILPIPVLTCNYTYMVVDIKSNNFVLVDVGDSTVIKNVPQEPDAILTTHKHWDHSAGNRRMRKAFPKLRVYGSVFDDVPNCTDYVTDGDVISFGRLRFTAIWTPGHTRGHVVWQLHGEEFGVADSLFTGDHLMLAGCGVAFEGPVRQMIASLDLMKTFPNDTMVWPGHEMGMENLELASFIEQENDHAVLKLVWAATRRDMMLCTCPSTIGEEKTYNPFLRTNQESMWKALNLFDKIKNTRPVMQHLDIGALVFEHVVLKASEMNKMKKDMIQTKIQTDKMKVRLRRLSTHLNADSEFNAILKDALDRDFNGL